MKKLLVRAIDCLLVDISTGAVFVPERATVSAQSPFVTTKISVGQLTIDAELPEEANDDEWLAFLQDSDFDFELALKSYNSKLLGEDEAEAKAAAEAEAKAAAEAEAKAKAKAEAEAKAAAEAEAEAKAAAEAEAKAKAEAEAKAKK